jgi:hypothetical protein
VAGGLAQFWAVRLLTHYQQSLTTPLVGLLILPLLNFLTASSDKHDTECLSLQ